MASVGVIEKTLSFLYVQSSCWMWIVRKGVRLRLGRHWVTSRSSHFFRGVYAVHLILCSLYYCWAAISGWMPLYSNQTNIIEGWVIVDAVGWVNATYLLCEGVGTIVLWDGGGSCLCKHLCCRMIVAIGMWANYTRTWALILKELFEFLECKKCFIYVLSPACCLQPSWFLPLILSFCAWWGKAS
jgi:hypothetical protein